MLLLDDPDNLNLTCGFKGTIEGNAITGKYTGAFGELNCTGKRESR